MTSLEKDLRDFAQFAASLKGDEKSEAQTFLFHLLEAFGHSSFSATTGSRSPAKPLKTSPVPSTRSSSAAKPRPRPPHHPAMRRRHVRPRNVHAPGKD
jgi:hypothetical protein